MALVRFDNITRRYSEGTAAAVDGLDLDVRDGEFMVLVGPSGCGKSTTLRMLAGLEPVDSGTIRLNDTDITNQDPRKRDIAMVFQSYALYPHMTVAENIGFHLKVKGVPKAERRERIHSAAELLDLVPYLDRKPAKLSGGQRQRVAMGRAIVRQPSVFLMDEPLSNLDAKLRVQTRAHIAALQRRLGVTTLYVTHDQVEAMTMGDRVAVLHDGRLQQCATPRALYSTPANVFVAGFVGSPAMNLLQGHLDNDGVRIDDLLAPVTPSQRSAATSPAITIGVRPDQWKLDRSNGVNVRVHSIEELGNEAFLHGVLSEHGPPVVVRIPGLTDVQRDDVVNVSLADGEYHVFDTSTGLRLP